MLADWARGSGFWTVTYEATAHAGGQEEVLGIRACRAEPGPEGSSYSHPPNPQSPSFSYILQLGLQ